MALGDLYVSLARFKSELDIPSSDTQDDGWATTCLQGSQSLIDEYCKRQFNDSGSATARTFAANPGFNRLLVDDFSTTTGLTVEAGTVENDFSTDWVEDTDFFVGPRPYRNETSLEVYWRIQLKGTRRFPVVSRGEDNLRVTARWGWPSVPERVVYAQILQATRLFRRQDSPEGVLGGFDGEPVRVGWKLDPDIARSLNGLRKHVEGRFF